MLPEQAHFREYLRRCIYDLHLSWGYQPVHPPFVEYLESLLSSAGRDFDRQTFKIADPVSGRMMGVRADMTPQVARIDAHQLSGNGISRLFYLGTVIRAYGDGGGGRSPLQLGAELFGHSGIESDVEIIRLMLSTLDAVGVRNVHLDLGHVGIYRSLVDRLELSDTDQAALFDLLQRKAESDINQLAGSLGIEDQDKNILCQLCTLNGDEQVLNRAEKLLGGYGDSMLGSIAVLREIGQALGGLNNSTPGDAVVHYDLAELRGYQYHNGVVFAAYVPGSGGEIARGGRYDGIGEVFGSARPATGYSTDLKALMNLVALDEPKKVQRPIIAPFAGSTATADKNLKVKVNELRAAGEIVITRLAEHEVSTCDRILKEQGGDWLLENC